MDRRDRAAFWLVSVALGTSVFAIGGAPRWAAVATAALGLFCTAPYLTGRRSLAWRTPLCLLLLATAGVCLLQLVPLPPFLLGVLSPERLEHAVDAARGVQLDTPGWQPISADSAATLLEAAKLVGYVGIAIVCGRLSTRSRNAQRLFTLVAATVLGVAAVSWFHEAAGVRHFFGMYVAEHGTSSPLRSPFVNPNHFASLLALAAPLAAGRGLDANDVRMRWAWAAGAVGLAGTSLAIASRGGTLALVFGLAVFGCLTLRVNRPRGRNRSRLSPQALATIAIGFVGVGALLWGVMGARVGADLAATSPSEFADANSKFGAWRSALGLVADYPFTGVGRGAFETVFTAYHPPSAERTYAFVENAPLQLLVDLGIPLALALAGLGVLTANRAWRESARSHTHAGALAGVTAVMLHNLVDFGIELPGVAVPTVVLVAGLMRPEVSATSKGHTKAVFARAAAIAVAGAIVVAAALEPGLYDARSTLRARLAQAPDSADVLQTLRPHASSFPYDYLGFAVAAQRLIDLRSPSAPPVLNRALQLHPTHPGVRKAEGDLLFAAGYPEQAAAAYARSLELEYRPRLLRDLTRRFQSDELLLRAMPRSAPSPKAIGSLLAHKRAVAAHRYATESLERHAHSAELLEQAGKAALAVGDVGAAVSHLEEAFALAPSAPAAARLGDALLSAGDPQGAWKVTRSGIAAGPPRGRPRVALRWLAATASLELGRPEQARQELEAAIAEADSSSLRSSARQRMAEFEAERGNDHAAEFQRSKIREIEARKPL